MYKWLALVAATGLGLALWHHQSSPPGDRAGKEGGAHQGKGDRPVPVQAASVVAGDLKVYLDALGTVVPLNSVTVHSRIDGQLMAVNFREGQRVKAGDVLLQIDARPYQVALSQAEGQLARDQATLLGARQDLARYQTLLQQDSISPQQVEQQQALVKASEGVVKADQGQVDSARLNLAYCRVTAPVSGRLGLRQVDPGNMVHVSDAAGVVVINQFQPAYVTFALPEDNLPAILEQIHRGRTLPVEAWDRGRTRKLATGKLESLDNQIDVSTGTIKVKALFPNADENLFPNQFVNVRLLVETRAHSTQLPTAAVQRGTQGTYVFVVAKNNRVSARPVTLGPVDGDSVGVETGVQPGERVVIDGADKLKDGAPVQVVTP
ncbi:MAG TPA: MdtA/MuxA family multidrug efflux RND transporter periplasmic adaptor subunit, partial [Moraxellaceae bacterium]|nr:MdtA/MuxA family multidrug efflux RND transporter periplasmic adaptor subunit [Moraxellaceae bacterium]